MFYELPNKSTNATSTITSFHAFITLVHPWDNSEFSNNVLHAITNDAPRCPECLEYARSIVTCIALVRFCTPSRKRSGRRYHLSYLES